MPAVRGLSPVVCSRISDVDVASHFVHHQREAEGDWWIDPVVLPEAALGPAVLTRSEDGEEHVVQRARKVAVEPRKLEPSLVTKGRIV
jgi:hypothetical protein